MSIKIYNQHKIRLNRKTKDSTFTILFRQKKYALELYKTLHPEDTEATQNDLEIFTIENVLTNGMYNDLGLLVGNRLLILVEAQSTWNTNITLRAFLYLAESYQRFFLANKIDLFSRKKAVVPEPELYVIYTGRKSGLPKEMSLCKDYFGKSESALEIKLKMIYYNGESDIINQYIRFCNIFDEERLNSNNSAVIVENVLERCQSENILSDFLLVHFSEVKSRMYDFLTNKRYIWKTHIASELKIAREEGLEQGLAEGHARGKEEGFELGKAETMKAYEDKIKELEEKLAKYESVE